MSVHTIEFCTGIRKFTFFSGLHNLFVARQIAIFDASDISLGERK